MKAAVLRSGHMVVDTFAEPVPGEGEVLVAVHACGICGSDLHFVHHGANFLALTSEMNGVTKRPPVDLTRDVHMGHEFCAEVLEWGPRTTGPKPGTLVTSMPVLMRNGERQSLSFSNSAAGAYGERMVLSSELLVPVPSGVTAVNAALTEPLAVGLHAVNASGIQPGQGAVVIGCGPVGLTLIACLKNIGVSPVIASDYSSARRAIAVEMGADVVVDPTQQDVVSAWQQHDGKQPLVVFEAVGVPGLINTVMRDVPRETKIVVVGLCMEPDTFQPVFGVLKELTLQFVVTYSPQEFEQAMHLIAEGDIDVSPMVTGQVGLNDIAQAFSDLSQADQHTKIMVMPLMA
jgi:2-desacetyl-2-hydroxyethyl bacteriochlorophyllide A dehydrogenase